MDLTSLLFSFNGRINRGKWWLAVVIFIVYGVVASIVAGVVLGGSLMGGDDIGTTVMIGIGILFIVNLVAMFAGLAVGVKRLHDRNKSGWWILLLYVFPMVLGSVGPALGETPAALLLALIALALFIWAFVELACLRGTVGPNKYGPDPLEADETQRTAAA